MILHAEGAAVEQPLIGDARICDARILRSSVSVFSRPESSSDLLSAVRAALAAGAALAKSASSMRAFIVQDSSPFLLGLTVFDSPAYAFSRFADLPERHWHSEL